jgi:hypothetical protein
MTGHGAKTGVQGGTSGSARKALGSLAGIAGFFKLGLGKSQLELIRQVAVSQQQVFEKQSQLKQLIFEIRHFLEKELPEIDDKVVARLKIDLLTHLITDSGIDTRSFLEIPDKEYFSTTLELLNRASTDLSPYEKEADLIRSELQRLQIVMKQLGVDQQSFAAEAGGVKSTPVGLRIGVGVVVVLVAAGLAFIADPYLGTVFLLISLIGVILWQRFRRKDDGGLLKRLNDCLEGYGGPRLKRVDAREISLAFEKVEEDYSSRVQLIIGRHPRLEELLEEGV